MVGHFLELATQHSRCHISDSTRLLRAVTKGLRETTSAIETWCPVSSRMALIDVVVEGRVAEERARGRLIVTERALCNSG